MFNKVLLFEDIIFLFLLYLLYINLILDILNVELFFIFVDVFILLFLFIFIIFDFFIFNIFVFFLFIFILFLFFVWILIELGCLFFLYVVNIKINIVNIIIREIDFFIILFILSILYSSIL